MKPLFPGSTDSSRKELLMAVAVMCCLPVAYLLYGSFRDDTLYLKNWKTHDITFHEAGKLWILNNRFTFHIPVVVFESDSMNRVLKLDNPDIQCMTFLLDERLHDYASLGVSEYTLVDPVPIKTAVEDFKRFLTRDGNKRSYTLIASDQRNVGSWDLYRLILRQEEEYCTILYYFMEEAVSDRVYEIKTDGCLTDLVVLMAITEVTAMTASYTSWPSHEEESEEGIDCLANSSQVLPRVAYPAVLPGLSDSNPNGFVPTGYYRPQAWLHRRRGVVLQAFPYFSFPYA